MILRDLTAYGILISQVLENQISLSEFTFSVGIVAGFTTWLTEMIQNFSYLRLASVQMGYMRYYLEMDDGYGEEVSQPVQSQPSGQAPDHRISGRHLYLPGKRPTHHRASGH